MRAEDQAMQTQHDEIISEMSAIYKANMKFIGYSVPECDETYARELILKAMQEALVAVEKESL
ncbi:MAG: hypothetical protein GQ570_08285 [Helicobacteraceae bacterium]|nr:hypothetical protein [Helicobacteraceae bacterium]